MSLQRFAREFEQEDLRSMAERSHLLAGVSGRLGVSAHSLYKRVRAITHDKTKNDEYEILGRPVA